MSLCLLSMRRPTAAIITCSAEYSNFDHDAEHENLSSFQAVLNETSYGLHRLTQRQGLIKEFDIILPKSWHVPSCEPGRQMTSVQRANPARPDIFVDAKAAADNRAQTPMGPRPWTEQPQGCGQPGYAIHLPSSFLNFASSSTQRQIYKDSWELRIKGKSSSSRVFTSIIPF